MRAVIAFLVSLGPAWAEPWIDYELLFRQNADRVVVTRNAAGTETRSIDFGDGVSVSCSDDGSCFGTDMKGAVGCTFALITEVKAIAKVCPLPVPPEQIAGLDRLYELFGSFVARNAVPPQEWSDLAGYVDAVPQPYRDVIAAEGPEACEEVTQPDSDVLQMLNNLLQMGAPENEAKLAQGLSRPRLPVMNPCL